MYILQVYIGKDVGKSFFFHISAFVLGKNKVCAGGGSEQCRCCCGKQKDTNHYVG
jgi:hypothetical protein